MRRRVKLIQIQGGLGNQLFQYFFGIKIGKEQNADVAYFGDPISNSKPKTKLEYVVKDVRYATTEELIANKFKFKDLNSYRQHHRFMVGLPMLRRDVRIEKVSPYNKHFSPKINVFEGYWQCYKYFVGYEEEIRSRFYFTEEIMDSTYIDEIRGVNSVFVHIRRGDYMLANNQEIYANCPIEYYQTAINHMLSHVDSPTFFVFSDDIEWVKQNLKISDANMEYVSHMGKLADLKDWYCMLNCKHAIMANSSFSWWAAWIISNPSKIVIAPKTWYLNSKLNKSTKELVPEEWIRL